MFCTPFTDVQLAAVFALAGALLGELLPLAPRCSALLAGTTAVSVLAAGHSGRGRKWRLLLLLLALTAGRAQWLRSAYNQSDVMSGRQVGNRTLLTGRVASVPVLSVRPPSRFAPAAFGNPATTRFLLDVERITEDGQTQNACGRCYVYVDGDLATRLQGQDTVQLSGELSWPDAPRNPGEFDFAAHLRRQRISSLVFVNHPDAVAVVTAATWWQPLRLASVLRQRLRRVITSSVHAEFSPIALALLLGNRHQLPAEVEDAFVASGAMHLLAISGLHVGILFGFLVRVGNWLFAARRKSLLAAVLICVLYCAVTDFRPSVVRATVFCGLFAVSQLLGRSVSLGAVICVTALGMLLFDPAIIWSCGAWLSFLSVTALAMTQWPIDIQRRNQPPVSVTRQEQVVAIIRAGGRRAGVRFLQMAMILIFTLPLTAYQFHAIAPVGFAVNLLLIAGAGSVLGAGFLLLLAGGLCPAVSPVFGTVFNGMLWGMTWLVRSAGEWSWGHFYIPDLPIWFLVVWYAALTAAVLTPVRTIRVVLIGTMSVAVAGAWCQHAMRTYPVRCTVLSVGHGNCTVLETGDGRVFVIDAGAQSRGHRVSRVLSDFLWHAGYCRVDGVVISHADTDHINGLAGLLRRFPVERLFTTRQVLQSRSHAVQSLLQLAQRYDIPATMVKGGAVLHVGGLSLQFYQAAAKDRTSDDAASLVVVVSGTPVRVLLPADLAGSAALDVYQRVGPVDVLISAHHGSASANNRRMARSLRPRLVVVSARDFANRTPLECVFADSRQVIFTASGAVSVKLDEGPPHVSVFHQEP